MKEGVPDNDDYKSGTKLGRGANFKCIFSNSPITPTYIKNEGKSGRIKTCLVAMIAEVGGKRVYFNHTENHNVSNLTYDQPEKLNVEISGSSQYIGVEIMEWMNFRFVYRPAIDCFK